VGLPYLMVLIVILAVLASQAMAPVDFTYQWYHAGVDDLCFPCPTSSPSNGFFETCIGFQATHIDLGAYVDSTSTPADFNLTLLGGDDSSGGCDGAVGSSWLVTCLTCQQMYTVDSRHVCFVIVNQSQCSFSRIEPTRQVIRKGHVVTEHYEKTSSTEIYDKIDYGRRGGGGGTKNNLVDDNWRARIPESFRHYFTGEQLAAVPATNSWSTGVYFLLALTILVVVVVGSYICKKTKKHSEYQPLKELADKDHLLLS